ncbi:aminoglycoside phosphotransferase family protein [Methanospirillum stamsii]|uniref:Aminoglycoside phosphotransferase n=1 Tax=Methanospirillum stamsii TaxID=1277351 RepID=A0A2V2MPQ7_9EURY|nr:aminoglycoside phosphotransferase family protein [Methanospirillum stamsii]PWR70204.1 aminoglycoside phosphotransferase [Methanospirillum stamsii]
MTIRPDIYSEIQQNINILHIEPVRKGYSDDKKFLLTAKTGERFLLRITESDDTQILSGRKEMYSLMDTLTRYSSLVPRSRACWISEDSHSCIMIHEYMEGDDGEATLHQYSPDIQYEIGYHAGIELKKLHHLAAPDTLSSWYDRKKQKHERYCDACNREHLAPEELDLEPVHRYIADNIHLMKDVSQTFQHDDYHPANLIINNGQLTGIIDFNRYDWGDPIHDFYKLAFFSREISIPFSRGQIDGYFMGNVPPDFWKRYALYNAMSIVPSIVWFSRMASRKEFGEQLKKAIILIKTLIDDHKGFTSAIPYWYHDFHISK